MHGTNVKKYTYQSEIKLSLSYVAYQKVSCHHNKKFATKFLKSNPPPLPLIYRYLALESSYYFIYKIRVYNSAIKYKLCLSGLCASIVCSNPTQATLLSLALLVATEYVAYYYY